MVSPVWYKVVDFETAEIPLGGKRGAGKVALVDIGLLPMIARHSRKWHLCEGYARASSRLLGKKVRLHRVVMDVASGGSEVDHISRNRLDNRRSNLRFATRSFGARNKITRGVSKFPGVFWCRRDKKWRAAIMVDGRHKSLGYFASELDAARAYHTEALKLDPLLSFPVWSQLD